MKIEHINECMKDKLSQNSFFSSQFNIYHMVLILCIIYTLICTRSHFCGIF